MQCIADKTIKDCPCTYTSCDKRGKCCLCIKHHRDRSELPGCLFNAEYERTYDRSVANFMKMHGKG